MFPKNALKEMGGFDTSMKACYDYKLELKISLKYPFIALDEPTGILFVIMPVNACFVELLVR
jgi:hypothetical protein